MMDNGIKNELDGRKLPFYSSMQHYLLGALGIRWKRVRLAMVTVFIDDSGTGPNQKVAIASALIVESSRIVDLDKEMTELGREEGFLGENGIPDFHTSECVAANPHSCFSGWSEEKRARVCEEIRQIIKKYGVNACSIALEQNLYDELVPVGSALRSWGGKYHYTWAVREVIEAMESWAKAQNLRDPIEYIFDCMGRDVRNIPKAEVEGVMEAAEARKPGWYAGHYAFRSRKQTPGLQCADLLAWTSYCYARFALVGSPLHEIAEAGFREFDRFHPRGAIWFVGVVQTRPQLAEWVSCQRDIIGGRT
jgi:hypothetical protein